MKKILLAFLMVMVLFSSPAYTQSVQADSMTISDTFYDAYIDFTISTYQEINDGENLLYSPISLYYSLSMMSVFCSDDTYTEFQTLLGVDKETLLTQIPLMTADILVEHDDADYWFNNLLYYDNQTNIGEADYVFNETLLHQYQDTFDYELEDVTFYDGAAGEMFANRVNEGTNGFLNLTSQDVAPLLSGNILFNNTIYYTGDWMVEFDEAENYEDDFTNSDGSTSLQEYMVKEDTSTKYYENTAGKAVKTYFKDGTSMIYILPSVDTTIDDLLTNTESLKDFITEQDFYYHQSVNLTVPKMETSNKSTLVSNLENLGLTSIFDYSETTFPELTPYPFSIIEVMQATKLVVDEAGVEVAATTYSVGCAAGSPAPPIDFIVNRPFVYIIMSSTDIPLFIGNVNNF